MRHLEAYHRMLEEKHSLKLKTMKRILWGVPRVGKTSFMRRITGEFADLSERGLEEPSTGATDAPRNVVIRKVSTTTALVSGSEWMHEHLHDEACRIFELISAAKTNPTLHLRRQPTTPYRPVGVRVHGTSPCVHLCSKRKSHDSKLTFSHDAAQSSTSTAHSDVDTVFEMFQQSLRNGRWEELKPLLEDTTVIRMIDTGGQPEFHEMLAALALGPALHLLFFNLSESLQDKYKIQYVCKDGMCTTPHTSAYSVQEVLFKALSSIACFNADIENGGTGHIRGHTKSVALLVGTHKDLVSDDLVMTTDHLLQQKIRPTDFFKKGLVQFSSSEQLILAVDNKTGGLQEVRHIQKLLENLIHREYGDISLPASWLLFDLFLRRSGTRIVSFQECVQIGRKFSIDSEEELKEVLWFLHHQTGVLMYYPEIPGLEDVVICDIQVIFDSITLLIVHTFTFEKVNKALEEKFKQKGMFSEGDIQRASSNTDVQDLIPLSKLVKLLEYVHILAPITNQHGCMEYFMPSVLPCAPDDQLTRLPESPGQPAPLLIHFECGFTPVGVFCALIVHLLAHGSCSEMKWRLIDSCLQKNRVKFHVGPYYIMVILTSLPTFYEVAVDCSEQSKDTLHLICNHVRRAIQTGIDAVTVRMNYSCRTRHQPAFYCCAHQCSSKGSHLAVCDRDENRPRKMQCLQSSLKDPMLLQPEHAMWFQQVSFSYVD